MALYSPQPQLPPIQVHSLLTQPQSSHFFSRGWSQPSHLPTLGLSVPQDGHLYIRLYQFLRLMCCVLYDI